MKVAQISVSNLDKPELLKPLQNIDPNFVLVFGSPTLFAQHEKLASYLKAAFPNALRVGCSTAGEICGTEVKLDSLSITAAKFDHLKLKASSAVAATMDESKTAGSKLGKEFNNETRALFILGPGVGINGSALIEGVRTALPANVPLTGGLAGDNGAFTKTYTLLNDTISDRQVVGVGFYGSNFGFYHGSYGGWEPFGPARRVTRSQGNELFELDGEPALDVYKKYLGEHAKGLPASGLLFPFAMIGDDNAETGLIRTILGLDEKKGSLTLAGDIIQNGLLRLMHASTDRLVDGAESAAKAASQMGQLGSQGLAVLVSCIGRRLVMGDRVDEEVEAVAGVFGKQCSVTGFYSNGEISPMGTTIDCKLHNQTMTVTYITET